MKILGVETSTERCSAALLADGAITVDETLAGQRHSELLLGSVRRLLAERGLALGELDGIAFGAGPGSFTGLRIACGVAQGLAFGAHKRLAAVATLEALAEQAAGAQRVIAALDARMGEVYFAAYERTGADWRAVVAPCLGGATGLPALEGAGWTGIGSGFDAHPWLAQRYAPQLDSVLAGRLPSAREIAVLGAAAFAQGRAVAPEFAAPLYLRDKVAMTTEERLEHHARKATPETTQQAAPQFAPAGAVPR